MADEPEVFDISSDSDHSDYLDPEWKQSLRQCLDKITAAGKISFFKQYREYATPGLKIGTNPQIPLPLTEKDAQLIKSLCRQAPFGKGDETVVDVSVRKTWELTHNQFSLENPYWTTFCKQIVTDTTKGLGLQAVTAKLDKLLLYEPGSFFKRHKDTEKETGMIGTLVICLPSKHEGSDVHLSFGSEKLTLQTAPSSDYDLTALAWYSDVDHEIKELISGYRLVLTYKLFQTTGAKRSATAVFEQRQQLSSILSHCGQTMEEENLAYCMDHQYTQSSISLQNMKGRDRAVCDALNDLCSDAGLYLLFAHATHSRQEDDYYDCGDEGSTTLTTIYSTDGHIVARNVDIEDENVLKTQYDDRDPDSEDEGDYTGNENAGGERRYHDTVALLVRKSELQSLLRPRSNHSFYSSGPIVADPMAVRMVSIVAEDLGRNLSNKNTVATAMSFMVAALGRDVALDAPTAATLTQWALILGNLSLIIPLLAIDLNTTPGRQVNTSIAFMLQARFDNKKDEVEWDKWLGFIARAGTVSEFSSALTRFSTNTAISEECKESLKRWGEPIVDRKLAEKRIWKSEDYAVIISKLAETTTNEEWVMKTFLPSVASGGERALLYWVLQYISSERTGKLVGKATEMYKYILETAGSTLVLQPNDLKPISKYSLNSSGGWSQDVLEYEKLFLRMIEEGYLNEAGDEAFKVLEASFLRLQSTAAAWRCEIRDTNITKDFLLPLLKGLEKYNVQATSEIRWFYTECLQEFHKAIPKQPNGGLQGWAHRPRKCTNSYRTMGLGGETCKDCQALNTFLKSRTEKTWHFQAGEPRRKHVTHDLTSEFFKLETTKNSVPHTLVVTKREPESNRAKKEYAKATRIVETEVKPLRCDYLKELLGEDKYEELVMLKTATERKRQADGGEASASKRRRH